MASVTYAVSVLLRIPGQNGQVIGKRKTTMPVSNLKDAHILRDSIHKAGGDREAHICVHVQTQRDTFLVPIEDVVDITERMMEISEEVDNLRNKPRPVA